MAAASRRRDIDLMKLVMSDYDVKMLGEDSYEFEVLFAGPEDTPYAGGVWRVHVQLPKDYPFKSPSIGFRNRMFHPNVDERSGSVCLDVINQTWSPMFDLINVFDMFLPQLLRYPNADDPLNGEAAALMLREPDKYNMRVKEHVQRHALPATAKDAKTASASSGAGASASASAAASAAASAPRTTKSVRKVSDSSDTSHLSATSDGTSPDEEADMSADFSLSLGMEAAACGGHDTAMTRQDNGDEDDDDSSVVSDMSDLSDLSDD